MPSKIPPKYRVTTTATSVRPACVHVVARHAVLAADLVEERERLFLGFDMLDGGDEAALLLDDRGARTTLSCAIRGHAAPFVFGKTQLRPIIAHARKQAGAGRGRC